MMLTKGAIGNLINRYSAVLKKCSLINTFGSLAVAGMLVAGGAVGVQAADVIKNGETASITEKVDGKVIGGLRLSGNIDLTKNTVDSTNITVSANVTDDICGGGYLSTPTGAIVEMMTGETNLTITTGASTNGIVIAGNRVVSYPTTSINKANTVLSNANLTISGGTFNNKVIGSSYAKAIGQNQDNEGYHGEASALTTRTNTQIAGGTFKDMFVGGGLAESLGTAGTNNGNYAKSETGIVYTQIKGGSFENSVIGGGLAHNKSNVIGYVSKISAPVEQAALIITGGTFNKRVIGGGYATGTDASATAGSTTVNITGGTFNDDIVAGGYDAAVTGNTSLAISGITMNTVKGDVVGGGAASKKTADVGGDTSVTISGTITGGLQGNVYGGGLVNGNASGVTANVGGSTSVSLASVVNEAVFGGGRARSQSNGATANVAGNTTVTLLAGATAHGVAGGGWAHDYQGKDATANVTGNTNLTINGGSVEKFANADKTQGIALTDSAIAVAVVGGGVAGGKNATANVIGSANTTINGGTVTGDVVGGGFVYTPSRGSEQAGGTATVGTTNVAITGGTFEKVYGGGYATGAGASAEVTGDTTVNITGGTFNDDIVAGGYAEKAATSTAKNTYLTISNTSLAAGGDITGAGRASGAFSTVSGDTHVIINAVSENGYRGNVYGGGSLNGGGDVSVGGNTNVTINNAVKINETVFGGGSARGQYHFTAGKDNIYGNANVAGNTNVTVNGTASVAGIIGGGWGHRGSKTAQETTPTTFIAKADVSGTTNVSIHGGTINKLIYDSINDGKGLSLAADSGISLVGGGASSGQDAYGTATAKAGATNVSITGGTIEGAVVGGGLGYVRKRGSGSEDFGIYGGGDASVTNTAKTTITGGELKGNVYGGGAAVGATVAGVPDKYFDKNNDASTSTMNLSGGTANVGNTEVNINGGTFRGNIFGGGYALMTGGLTNNNGNETASQANVTGNTNITISGGTFGGDIYTGGYAKGAGAKADVTNASITISGGTFKEGTHIYAGGYANGSGATAKVTGTGTVTFLANNTNGYAGVTVVGAGKADNGETVTVDKSTLAFGNGTTVYNNTFSGKFKDFDTITVAKGSSVNLGVLTTETDANLTKNTTNFNGEGTVEASQLIVKSKDVTIANGVVKITGTQVGDIQNNDATAISVNRAGVLEIEKSAVLAATETPEGENAYDLATVTNGNLSQFTVTSGGVIKLNGFTAKSLTDTQAADIKSVLLASGSAGMINFGKDVITFTRDKTDGTVAEDLVANAGAIAEGETVKVADAVGTDTKKTTTINGGYGADAIKVDKATTGDTVTATVKEDLTLLGTADGKLVDAGGATVNIELAKDKALNLGSAGAASHDASIDSVKLGTDSAVNAAAATYTVGSITTTALGGSGIVTASAGGTLKVSGSVGDKDYYLSEVKAEGGNISVGGELHATTVSVTGGTIVANDVRPTDITLNKGGTLITEKISVQSTGKIIVGSTDGGAGTLIAKTADLNGASLFLDPAWIEGKDYQDAALASRAAFEAFKDKDGTTNINGKITVGENSQLSLGTADVNWLTKSITDMGSSVWGAKGITAALGIYSPQTLDNNKGALLVDGKQKTNPTLTANTAEFRANSLLAVYAPNMLKDAALKGNNIASTLTVDKDAKLHIMGGKANDTVHIVSGFKGAGSTIDSTSWSGANLTTDSKLLTANAGTLISGAYDVTLSQNSTRSIFPKLDKNMSGLVDGMVRQIGLDPMSENYGQRFVSRAVSDSYIGSNNTKEAAATIEGAAKMAFAGAAPQMGMNLANAAGNIAGLRNSLSAAPQGAVVALNADGTSAQEGLSAGDGMKNGLGLWVMPTYQNQQGFGFESGDFETGYKSNAAGVALGADYTFNDMFRVGAQFNVGGGYAESTGDFNSTDNRFNYWGLGLYAGYQYQNFGLTADFGYSANNNELEQSLPSAMQMAKLKADAKTDTITAGLRGEYKITTDALDIVPHLGVRMTNMHMDSFNVKSDKHKVFKADDMNATVWTFPVGVTFSKDIETSNGWTIKPSLDLAIIPAAGDIEAKQDIKIVGVNGTASMESNIMDAISYQGSLGLSAKNDNGVSVGVNYTLQAGAHTTDHGVQATFRYEF